jgi:hypothetical protein
MKRTPERRAWLVLFASLFTCLALAVGVPTAVLAFVNNATNDAYMFVRLQAGKMVTLSPTQSPDEASVVGLAGRALKEDNDVIASDRTVGQIAFAPAEGQTAYIRTQLYSNTRVTARRARRPRFQTQAARDVFEITLKEGRIGVVIDDTPRAFEAHVRIGTSGTQLIITTPGVYTADLQTDGRLRLTARNGLATLERPGAQTRTLQGNQQLLLGADGTLSADLPLPDNLIRNGFFMTDGAGKQVARDWEPSFEIGQDQTVKGVIYRQPGLLTLERTGVNLGYSRTGVRQKLGALVAGSAVVRLRVVFSLLDHSIDVCGSAGSECPLFVRINFETPSDDGASVVPRFWQQGFYGKGDPEQLRLPTFVPTYNTGDHIYYPLGTRAIFESDNLISIFGTSAQIKEVFVFAEGHQYRTQVESVELLIEE